MNAAGKVPDGGVEQIDVINLMNNIKKIMKNVKIYLKNIKIMI